MTWKPEITWKSPETLRPYHQNTKSHPQDQLDQIMVQIHKHGFTQPILVDKDMVLIAGHGRLQASLQLGLDQVPVIIADHLTDEEVRLTRIADNKVAQSDWDLPNLRLEFGELDELNADLALTGFTLPEIEDIMIPEKHYEEKDSDSVPSPPEEAITKPGDIIFLGRHKLICGDSSSNEDIRRLTCDQRVDMIFTDPPYGMNLDTDFSKMGDEGLKHRPVQGDDQEFDPTLLLSEFQDVDEIILFGADYYAWSLPRGGSWYVWDKRSREDEIGKMDGAFGSDFEIAWSKTKHKREIARILRPTNWLTTKDEKSVHPTQKPVALAEWFFKRIKADTVLDLFGGSGSTLIACEKTDKTCMMMEIDPLYCDIIVKRWEEFTGESARRCQDELSTLPQEADPIS